MASDSASNPTSPSLLARARANDAEAWNRLVTLYAPLVLHWCRRSSLSQEDVADVFQEVFQSAARNLARFSKDRPSSTFRGWLRTITRSKVHDLYRRRKREPLAFGGSEMMQRMHEVPGEGIDGAEDEGDGLESRAWSGVLLRGLEHIESQFKPRTWRAFWLTVVDGRPPSDVGSELEMSPGAVRVAKSRVLQRLRAELGERLS